MTDEEKKAIEYVKEFIEELQCDINMFGFEDDCEEEQNLLVEQQDNFKIILNLIQKQQAELEKKDKIIDLIITEIWNNYKQVLKLDYGAKSKEELKQCFERKIENEQFL